MTDLLTLRRPDDMHVHLREDEMLEFVLPYTARSFARALVMPNLKVPIVDGAGAKRYRDDIRRLCNRDGLAFEPLMTIKLTQATTARTIREARAFGVVAAKLYPEGVTTNSEDGVRDVGALDEVFSVISAEGMVLCVHAEAPGVFCLDREGAYLPRVQSIVEEYPDLRVVVEHVSTDDAVKFVMASGPNVAATITAHHLVLTLDDVVGGSLSPHNFCKPIAKRQEDRAALVRAAAYGNSKFFLGTDSAPHRQGDKECCSGCAGCFTAPIAMPLLAQVFEREAGMSTRLRDALERFTSVHGAKFYGLPLNEGTITLRREPTVVKREGSVVPFMAGKTLEWSEP